MNYFKHHIKIEYQKITNLFGNIPDKVPRVITKKRIEVHDQSGEIYYTKKQIRFETSMLGSDLCDYSNADTVVEGIVSVSANAGANNIRDKKQTFSI